MDIRDIFGNRTGRIEPVSGRRACNRKSDSNCKTCGNYESWAGGKNYTNK